MIEKHFTLHFKHDISSIHMCFCNIVVVWTVSSAVTMFGKHCAAL